MFRASSCPSSWSLSVAVAASGLPLECGGSSAVGRGRADRPDHDQQHCYHHVPTVNQRRLLQLISSMMMGMRMPETCWTVFKRQAINLRDLCIWLVDLFEYMMMHGLTNPKFRYTYLIIFEKSVEIFQVHKNLTRLTGMSQWRPKHIYDNISRISSKNEKCFGQRLQRESKHTFYVE